MGKTVVGIGEMLWDVFGKVKKVGDSSLNVALHLQKQGLACKFVSAIGNDELGKELLAYLKAQGLPTEFIQTNTLPTSTVTVKLDKRHQATYEIVQPVAWDAIQINETIKIAVQQADALVYCSLTCREETSRETILQLLPLVKLKVFDVNLRPPHYSVSVLEMLLQNADVVKLNDDEMEFLRETFELKGDEVKVWLAGLAKRFKLTTVCLTLGDKGAVVYHKGDYFNHSGFTVEVADTVGAGDAFLATFVAGYLNELPMEEILERACKVGAFVASQAGANPDYGEEVFK